MARTREYDGSDARRVLAAIIQDSVVCGRVAALWKPEGLFDVGWANLAASLAVKYYRKYNTAPNGNFTGLFENWAENTTADVDTVKAVERFLRAVSDDAEMENEDEDYLLDLAASYFDRVALGRDLEAAGAALQNGKAGDARQIIRDSNPVNLGAGGFIEPLVDVDYWMEGGEERSRPLLYYRGSLGQFTEGAFVRGTFFSFVAPDKTGKTAWLVDAVYRGIRNGCRVCFFEMGDGDKYTFRTRLGMRATGRPEFGGSYWLPERYSEESELWVGDRQSLDTFSGLDGYLAARKIGRREDALRWRGWSNSTASVADLEATLADWDRADWRPDIVVIDYADIMAPMPGANADDPIDETWKALRRLSQDRQCLVLTATQSDAGAYKLGKKSVLTKANFSGRKTKNAHVDGMLGINVNNDEKDQDACRINWVARRRGAYNERDVCRVAGCLAVANPAMVSYWWRVDKEREGSNEKDASSGDGREGLC